MNTFLTNIIEKIEASKYSLPVVYGGIIVLIIINLTHLIGASKMTGDKVYSVNIRGEISEYTIVEKRGWGPQNGCDILVEDKQGNVYSGSSKDYFLIKREALLNAKKRTEGFIEIHEATLCSSRKALKVIIEQLIDLGAEE